MTTHMTAEQRDALAKHQPGTPVPVLDDESLRTFWLIAPEDLPKLWNDHLEREVGVAIDAVEVGELSDWDPDFWKERAKVVAARAQDRP